MRITATASVLLPSSPATTVTSTSAASSAASGKLPVNVLAVSSGGIESEETADGSVVVVLQLIVVLRLGCPWGIRVVAFHSNVQQLFRLIDRSPRARDMHELPD
jgi:hypothetical protein